MAFRLVFDTTTQNGALSLATSGSALTDLFFKLTRDVTKNPQFEHWLDAAWSECPLDTMRIIFQGRDCRGGKGDRAPFLFAFARIANTYPEWFLATAHLVPEYGRWLDLIELMPMLHDAQNRAHIVKLLTDQLRADEENLQNGTSVSLLAKWMPSEKSKMAKASKIIPLVCRDLFPSSTFPEKQYRQCLTRLRAHIDLVEQRMCKGEWDTIPFSKVPSVAMSRLRKAFKKHSPEEFDAWITAVAAGTSKINASQVYPHDLVRKYLNAHNINIDPVIEEQWKAIVAQTASLGLFKNSIVVSDVSGSMMGTPMEVSIALGILIATVTEPPFDGLLITFSENPMFFALKAGLSLCESVDQVKDMNWGGSTDLQKVFQLILHRAVDQHIDADAMPKRIFILSDMQFNEACNMRKTNYDNIRVKYEKAGYALPQIVFWNLRSDNTRDVPVRHDTNGVALLSGYSPAILKSLMTGVEVTPFQIMRAAIDDVRYAAIKSI